MKKYKHTVEELKASYLRLLEQKNAMTSVPTALLVMLQAHAQELTDRGVDVASL